MEKKESYTDWVKNSQKLMEKSFEANTKMLKAAANSFSNIMSRKTDWNDLQKFNNRVFKHTVTNVLELNLKYAESLINLSLQFSKDLNHFLAEVDDAEDADSEIINDNVSQTQRNAQSYAAQNLIQIIGENGETTYTTFTLNNTANIEREGTFRNSRCISDETGKFTNIWIKFDPESFKIPPGGKQEIEISATIPKSSEAGSYRCTASIEGFENTNFEIVVFVQAKAE